MSWLFTRPEGMDLVNVRASLFDDAQSFVPYMETYTCEKLPWAATPAVHRFEKFPSPDDYPQLLTEFSERRDSHLSFR
jgi:hypothetical protein